MAVGEIGEGEAMVVEITRPQEVLEEEVRIIKVKIHHKNPIKKVKNTVTYHPTQAGHAPSIGRKVGELRIVVTPWSVSGARW